MRGIEALLFESEKKTPPAPKKDLREEAIQLLKEELSTLEKEVSTLRLRVLQQDKRALRQERAVRSAEEDADVLLEAVSELSRSISNDTKAGRNARERVRRLLESRKIPPPSTLGSSRKRASTRGKTTEST